MGFSSLVKQVKQVRQGEKLSFFQSSYPYLHKNALISFQHFFNAKWSNEEPHPSQTTENFLGIDNGHFGVYFTMYSHDADKKRKPAEKILHDENAFTWDSNFVGIQFFDKTAKFIISKVNNDIYVNVNNLKVIIRHFLSTLSIVYPKNVLSVELLWKVVFKDTPRLAYVEDIQPEILKTDNTTAKTQGTFESELLASQSARIKSIYDNYKDASELRIIYPLYQALRRNDIDLSNIELYNIVLDSIVKRDLNNENLALEEIETRLTDLMTVYQEILSSSVKPNERTFNIVISALLAGALDAVKIGHSNFSSQDMYNIAFTKSQEYGKVGIDLLMSIKNPGQLEVSKILEKSFLLLNYHPHLLSQNVIKKLMSILPESSNSTNYYIGLLGLTKYFGRLAIFQSNDELYDFIVTTYGNYQVFALDADKSTRDDGTIYASLIQTLILNGNFPLATKFLDDILIDYKKNLTNSNRVSKEVMSNLLSTYLQSIIDSDPSAASLKKAYSLMTRFKEISYLPEMSIELYNKMIISYINQYHILEAEKIREPQSSKQSEMEIIQASYYRTALNLYDYMALRKDYHMKDFELSHIAFNTSNINCRDVLLSTSIDLGDHERVFQLIKEIILKNHLIKDSNTSKKLHSYLLNGTYQYAFNRQYFELLWNIIESQSVHYKSTSASLNNFLSQNCVFLLPENNDYIAELLLESKFIFDCFQKFDLSQDNCYGVVSVCNALMSYSSSKSFNELSQSSRIKLINLYAYLIEQFEDTENHYLPVQEDLKSFKPLLKAEFSRLVQNSPDISNVIISDVVEDACKSCKLELIDQVDFEKKDPSKFSMNLTYLLTTNYDIGIERFVQMFQKGYLFNKSTWNIAINSSFVTSLLEEGRSISTAKLVERLFESNLEYSDKISLLVRMIEVGSDKVNIDILKLVLGNKLMVKEVDILGSMMSAGRLSENRYFISKLYDGLEYLISENRDMKWLAECVKFLEAKNENSKIISIAESFNLEVLNLTEPENFEFIKLVLRTSLRSNNLKLFSTIVESHFSVNSKYNYLLQKSDELLKLLVDYYTSIGSFETVTNNFAPLASKFEVIESSILFADIMSSLHSKKPVTMSLKTPLTRQTPNQKALVLMSHSDATSMYNVLKDNGPHKNFNTITGKFMENLIHAASLNEKLGFPQTTLVAKFEAYIKLLKLLRVKSLKLDTFIQIIRFSAQTDRKATLNVILNKLIYDGEFASMINFYFLDIDIPTAKDVLSLLQSLKSAFSTLGDPINVEVIDDFCSKNNLSI